MNLPFHLKMRPLPIPLTIGHALLAATGFILLRVRVRADDGDGAALSGGDGFAIHGTGVHAGQARSSRWAVGAAAGNVPNARPC